MLARWIIAALLAFSTTSGSLAQEHLAAVGWGMTNAGGTVTATGGSPALVTAPTVSPGPTVTQGSPSSVWNGNTVTLSNGTWNNCSSCTYSYQWWTGTGFHNAGIGQDVQSASYTVPSSTVGAASPFANSLVWATVTATNAYGSAMSAVLPTPIQPIGVSGNPVMVTPPVVQKCTDSTCATTNPIGNTLGVGDYLKITSPGTYSNAPSWTATAYGWSLQSEATGGTPANLTLEAADPTGQTFQILSSMPDTGGNSRSYVKAVISAHVTISTSIGSSVFSSPQYGTIQATPSTTIPLITPASLPAFVMLPSTAGAAYVGVTLQDQALDNAPWNDFPTSVTYQWYYCNSACTAPALGVLLSGTPINGFSGTSYQGGTIHVIDSADKGHQIFLRVTATNNGGTAQADSAPTAVITDPSAPPVNTNVAVIGGDQNGAPSISGLAVYGSVGAGSAGSVLVGDYGSWSGAITVTPHWYSCPPATPTCTTPATGPTGLTPSAYSRIGSTYQVVSADMGNVLRMDATGNNVLGSVTASSAPTATVASYTPPPNLSETPVRVYPAGQDVGPNAPTCASEPSDTPDAGGTTWHVDAINGTTPNATFGGTGTADGTAAHPFNSLRGLFFTGVTGYSRPLISTGGSAPWAGTPLTGYINPGDRVIVEGGNGTTAADYGNIGTFGGFKNTSGASGSGSTKYIKFIADATSVTPPVIDGLSINGNRGLDFKGFTFRPSTANAIVSVSAGSTTGLSQDIMVTDGLISPWDTLSAADAAYNAACPYPGTCAQSNFPNWAKANSALGVNITGSAGAATQCVAIDNNIIQLTYGGIVLQTIYPRSVLIEKNEIKYTLLNDLMDYSNSASIFHLNYEHDGVGGQAATGTHLDAVQSQIWNNITFWGLYGMVFDGDTVYSYTTTDGAALKNFADPRQCVTNGEASTCTDINYTASISNEEGTGNYYTGNKRVNNVFINGGHMAPPRSVLGTYANNTLMSDGAAAGTFEAATLTNSDYVANNVSNNWTCPIGTTATWPTNLGVPWGSTPTMPGTIAGCPTGITNSNATAPNFVSWSPWSNGNAVNPSTINMHPAASGGVLKNTGTAGNGAPTVDISGTTRSVTTPSIGAYE